MEKLLNREAPKSLCAIWVFVELMAIRIYFCFPLWKGILDILDCFRKSLWMGFVIFSVIVLALFFLEYLTFIRTKRSRVTLAILVLLLPLIFWLNVDFSILRPDSIFDFIVGLLGQMCLPILAFLVLCFDPILKKHFQK